MLCYIHVIPLSFPILVEILIKIRILFVCLSILTHTQIRIPIMSNYPDPNPDKGEIEILVVCCLTEISNQRQEPIQILNVPVEPNAQFLCLILDRYEIKFLSGEK
jgi:hypothetical protein